MFGVFDVFLCVLDFPLKIWACFVPSVGLLLSQWAGYPGLVSLNDFSVLCSFLGSVEVLFDPRASHRPEVVVLSKSDACRAVTRPRMWCSDSSVLPSGVWSLLFHVGSAVIPSSGDFFAAISFPFYNPYLGSWGTPTRSVRDLATSGADLLSSMSVPQLDTSPRRSEGLLLSSFISPRGGSKLVRLA